MSNKKTVITAIITALAAGTVSWCGRGAYDMFVHRTVISKVMSVQKILDDNFLYDYDSKKAADFAALAMTMSLDDPYTVYYNEKQFADYTNSGSGDFIGVGVTVICDKENDEILVVSVMDNSPGMEAGILPGDVITKVEGVDYSGSQMSNAVSKIKGLDMEENRENTEVHITVKRKNKEHELTLIRKKIHQKTVDSKLLDSNIGYIRISSFNGESETGEISTDREFLEAFKSLEAEGMEKLVIDVRDNGGGRVDVVSEIIDFLVPEGLIMYTEDRYGNRNEIKSGADEVNMPMSILVNENSASASELLTGALRDYGKAKVIGTKTFGKGVMQAIYPFADGSGMSVTIAKYYTPLGTCVQDEGITPDIVVEMPENLENSYISVINPKDDVQLKTALDYLKKQNSKG